MFEEPSASLPVLATVLRLSSAAIIYGQDHLTLLMGFSSLRLSHLWREMISCEQEESRPERRISAESNLLAQLAIRPTFQGFNGLFRLAQHFGPLERLECLRGGVRHLEGSRQVEIVNGSVGI